MSNCVPEEYDLSFIHLNNKWNLRVVFSMFKALYILFHGLPSTEKTPKYLHKV